MFKLIVLADLNGMFISYIEIIVDMLICMYMKIMLMRALIRQYA